MALLHIDIEPRTLHFRFPAGTSRGIYTERRIWLLHLSSPDNPRFRGTGECAPLPELSCELDEGFEERLKRLCTETEQRGFIDYELLRQAPSVAFALETARLDAEARLRGDTRLLDSPFSRGEAGITTNGLIWMGDRTTMMERVKRKLEAGFSCIKIKIGAIGFEEELSLLAYIRSRYSPEQIQLRVDANGAFPADEALERLNALASYGLHSIEQPIRAGQTAELARLCARTPLPIALDEELIGHNGLQQKRELLERVRPRYLVLKPSLHGGLTGCDEWIAEAKRLGIGFWITSALESNIGLRAIAQWAATKLNLNADPATPHTAQGLGTGMLFTDNIPMPQLQMHGEKLWYDRRS